MKTKFFAYAVSCSILPLTYRNFPNVLVFFPQELDAFFEKMIALRFIEIGSGLRELWARGKRGAMVGVGEGKWGI